MELRRLKMLSSCKSIKRSRKNKKLSKFCEINCIYSLQAQDISFCLLLKEVNIKCPAFCPFFVEGESEHYQYTLEKQYDINCLFCTRKKSSQHKFTDELIFYCTLYENPQPFCGMCPFASYLPDLKHTNEWDSLN